MVKLTVLAENRKNGEFKGEPGLSILVQTNDTQFLFDTGNSDLFLKNANLLRVNLDNCNMVVLSHGHSDHTNGLKHLDTKKYIVFHPSVFKDRWCNRTGNYSGMPMTYQELNEAHNLIPTANPLKLSESAYYLGEIPMVMPHESEGNIATSLDPELTIPDPTEDDSGVAIKTEKGLFVMTGCGHRGICNTIEHAMNVTGEKKVYAVLGGFHFRSLKNQKELIDNAIAYFKQLKIKHLYLGHCNTDPVIGYMAEQLPNVQIHRLASGKTFELQSFANEMAEKTAE